MLNQHKTVRDSIAKFNRPNPLVSYLVPFVGEKKYVEIADIGSGPFSTIGNSVEGVEVKLYLMDNQDFSSFWKKYGGKPFYEIEKVDMENISYANDWFDIVHCANALDHTRNAKRAVEEMIRVCKRGGWIYIDCCLYQMDTGHKHYWNVTEEGIFKNKSEQFDLKDFGFHVEYFDKGGEKRYNHMFAILKKPKK